MVLLDKEKSWRGDSLNDKIEGIVIDTCYTPDTMKWETGIEVKGEWKIVEIYKDEHDAAKGHEKWVKMVKENPNQKFEHCKEGTAEAWFFG